VNRGTLRRQAFLRNAASLASGRVAAAGFSAVWLVIAAQELPVGEFGDLLTLMSVSAIVITVSDLGLPFLLAHAVARSGKVSWSTILAAAHRRMAACAIAVVVNIAAYLVVAENKSLVVPATFSISLLATSIYSTMTGAMRGLGRFSVEATNEIASRLAVLAAGWLWLTNGGGLMAVVIVYVAADVASLVAITAVVARHVSPDDAVDLSSITHRRNTPTAIGRLLAVLYYRVDLWLVAMLRGSEAAGLYGAPYRILDGCLLLPRAVGAVVVTHAGRRSEEGRSTQSPTAIAAVAAVVVAVVAIPGILLADAIVRITFGERYDASVPILQVLLLSAVPGAIANVLAPLASVRDGRRFARSMASALAANLALNALLLSAHGPIAAAWATLFCQSALAIGLWRILCSDPNTARRGPATAGQAIGA